MSKYPPAEMCCQVCGNFHWSTKYVKTSCIEDEVSKMKELLWAGESIMQAARQDGRFSRNNDSIMYEWIQSVKNLSKG